MSGKSSDSRRPEGQVKGNGGARRRHGGEASAERGSMRPSGSHVGELGSSPCLSLRPPSRRLLQAPQPPASCRCCPIHSGARSGCVLRRRSLREPAVAARRPPPVQPCRRRVAGLPPAAGLQGAKVLVPLPCRGASRAAGVARLPPLVQPCRRHAGPPTPPSAALRGAAALLPLPRRRASRAGEEP